MILRASRIKAPSFNRQRLTPAQRAGLVYQRKVTAVLRKQAPKRVEILSTPWFRYLDNHNQSDNGLICSPDILAVDHEFKFIVVIEIKTTFTPLAFQKLRDVYCPVVSKAMIWPTKPLVICKNLGLEDPRPKLNISSALMSDQPLINWLGQGPIQW